MDVQVQSESISITVLGSGTSVGVPMIGCHCAVCHSDDPRDQRLRPSVHIQYGDRGVLIDTTPDFRYQALRSRIERVDAILFTHSHADHVMGLDDVRPFNYRQGGVIPIYGSEETIGATSGDRFRYIFDERDTESSRPRLVTHVFDGAPIDLFGLEFMPIRLRPRQRHGVRISLRRRCVSDRSQRHSRRIHAAAVRPGRAVPGRAAPQARIPRIPPWSGRSNRWRSWRRGARSSRTSVTIWRTPARRERLPPHVRLAYDGLEIRSGQRARHDLSQPGGSAGRFRPVRHHASAISTACTWAIGEILRRVVAMAREEGWKSAVLTFDPHPTKLVAPAQRAAFADDARGARAAHAGAGNRRDPDSAVHAGDRALGAGRFRSRDSGGQAQGAGGAGGCELSFRQTAAGDAADAGRTGRAATASRPKSSQPVVWRRRVISSSEIRRLI